MLSAFSQPEPERLSYRMDEAARLMGLSQSTLWRQVKAGNLETVKIGSRTLISRLELERLLTAGRKASQL